MRKFPIIIVALFVVLLQFSCGEKKKPAEASYDDWEEYDQPDRDSTIFGVCLAGSAMHSLQLLTDNGDTLMLDIVPAQEAEKVFGGYAIGDRMAVLTDNSRTRASMVLNLNTLQGDWVMPNPMDGTSEIGICIRDGGILESINQSSINYQTWRLVNGQLELVGIREVGGNFEETEIYDIKFLSEDSLSFGNPDETFEYGRPGKQEDYSDIELEDEDVEEMIF